MAGRRRAGETPAEPQPAVAPREGGQVAVETVGVLPVTAVLILALWEIIGLSLSFLWAGHAANAAAREAALGSSSSAVVSAAQDAVPSAVHGSMSVSTAGGRVEVTMRLAPWGTGFADAPVDVGRRVVTEPGA